MNSIQYHIKQNGLWQRLNATPVFPFSIGELLDERLDEAHLTVYDSDVEHIPRLSEIRATISDGTDTKMEYFIVASDSSVELPAGSGIYKHDIYLIERTKLLEGIFCSSLTFTNATGHEYVPYAVPVYAVDKGGSNGYSYLYTADLGGGNGGTFSSLISFPQIISPISSKTTFTIPPSYNIAETLVQYIKEAFPLSYENAVPSQAYSFYGNFITTSFTYNGNNYDWYDTVSISGAGTFTITYSIVVGLDPSNDLYAAYKFDVTFDKISDILPLKRWTITDCITRACELALPLFGTEKPKYRLAGVEYDNDGNVIKPYAVGSLAEKYDKVFAPEFTLTQDTLREQLRAIFSYVHAEPWLDENNVIQATEYGGVTASPSASLPYVYAGGKSHINEYCTEVRSHAQNLASSLGYAKGTMIDPGNGLYRSTRTDTAYTRITESNGIARTEKPIYEIQQVMCGIANPGGSWYLEPVEITPYVFEATEYSANLSPYKGGFPYSRAYAIYYTLGQPNINGLFYRAPNARSSAQYEYFSISYILSAVTGISAQDIDERLVKESAADLVFSITYKPISNHFISHGKNLYVQGETPFMMLYNQSENLVESQYYGEHLKGVAARLGNVEKERTFILKDIDDIPRVGQLLGDYAITAVSLEIYPFDIKCTVGLSKDFNRISEYVGINSQKRMYEVSERQATQRDILIKETLVIGTKPDGYDGDEWIFGNLAPFYQLFNSKYVIAPVYPQEKKMDFRISAAELTCANKRADSSRIVLLPVLGRSLGNMITLNFATKDNYSAGDSTVLINGANNVQGRWQTDTPYTNYYGRAWWASVNLYSTFSLTESAVINEAYEMPDIVPNVETNANSKAEFARHRLRKDNRETLSYNVELEIKTDKPDIIIGSALAELCGWVYYGDTKPVLYLFNANKYQVSKFDRVYTPHEDDIERGDFNSLRGINNNWRVNYEGDSITLRITNPAESGYGWVICTPIEIVTETVEDDDGFDMEVSYQTGGEILLASNKPLPLYSSTATTTYDFYVTKD